MNNRIEPHKLLAKPLDIRMNRRDVLKAAVTGSLLAGAVGNAEFAEAGGSGQTFVLVHGTWHGGWVWRDVAEILRARGHQVFTPTCTGCGERVHLNSPEVGLDTHIADVMNVIEWEELDEVVLVGHSFAGITITGVCDRLPDQIKQLVFFDALIPREGRIAGVMRDPDTGEYPDWWKARQLKFIDGYRMDMWEEYPIEMLVPVEYTAQVARLKKLITTHPAKQWTDELVLQNDGWEGMQRAFIHCIGQQYKLSSEKMVGPAREPGWDFIELDIPRDGMMTHPQLVADTFESLATGV